uniref:Pentatricopeptide repeat-containing protein At4g13650 n=1 Tax=Anthurium amnicola TaxID=1678845 RepID=A0A1D1ZF14_9ARAE
MPSAPPALFLSFSRLSAPHFLLRKPAVPWPPGRRQPKLLKFFAGHGRWPCAASFGHSAACAALGDLSEGDYGGNLSNEIPKRDGLVLLNLMEQRDVVADRNTYASLLDGCLHSGSLVDAQRIHGRVLKLGLDREDILCDRLLDAYSVFGDMGDAVRLFDGMYHRTIASWNGIIVGFLLRRQNQSVLAFFRRMLKECGEMDPTAFSSVLRACSDGNICWHFVQQVHAKIIRCGFSNNPVVGNPLIDMYSKNGYIHSAHLVFDELGSRDSTTWVAMLSGFSQNGLGEEAFFLYYQMHQSGIVPTPYVFSSVLSACTKSELFVQGKQLHAQAFKWGLFTETFVSNALICLYSRCGDMESAGKVFGGMPRRDGVTYNSLISAHAQHGNSNSAVHFFRDMQLSGFKPDSVTIAGLLSACASIGAIQKGMQLHSYTLKSGISSDIIIEGSLLDLYVKCADIETAHKFFDGANKDNVVLWNVMLVAYGQMGDLEESFDLFHRMQVASVKPNQYTYPSVLRTCTAVGAIDLGEQVHSLVVKTGYEHNVYVSSVLIDMYSKCGRLEIARKILETMTDNDVVSWTAMIAGYTQHEFYVEALETFEEMQIRGIQSDNIGLSSAISACTGILAIQQGLQVHAQAFVSGYSKDISIGNALTNFYARCGRLRDAYSAFHAVETKDEISWNGLISGFSQSGLCEEALNVFAVMNRDGVKANLFTFASVISAAANIADVKPGKQIHARMIKTGYDSEIEASNVLITLYSKCGCIEDAKMVFSAMSERNEVSWNAMITGYSQHGHGREALSLFDIMNKEGLKPNHVTFVGVLSACSHVGLVNEGINYFESMSSQHGIVPRPEHYACVVDILGRAGQLDRARGFIEEMPIDPDAMVWRTLLSACRVRKNIEIGEFAARHLLQLEPHDSATYVLLSNIYAVTRRWDCRDRMRQMMKDRGVRKEPGRSWIEVKNSLHAFFVGDRLHPLSNDIYKFLDDLNEKATEVGYKQDRESFLHDIEQEQRDPTIYVHSEKLAVAFGLISLSPQIPIRVIKNLRVCNDCHTWMKFVSRIMGRAIIVRDAYRFHHFKDGDCTCCDYW